MQRNRLAVATALSLAIVLAACGSSSKSASPTSTSTSTPAVSGPAIRIENGGSGFLFATTPVTAGATVTVKNNTAVQHTVSADTTAAGFDVTIDPGKTMTFTAPSKPGAYKFHCNIHTYMMGTLTVT